MYLDYQTYQTMGGDLDNSAFTKYNRKAEYLIKSQAGGKTGLRIGQLSELPQAVIDCTFDLIAHLSETPACVASESQSLGGQSESKSYLSRNDLDEETLEIIHIYLYPIKLDGYSILYKGDIPWDIEHNIDEYELLLEECKKATEEVKEAVSEASKAVDTANTAVEKAETATEAANTAVEKTEKAIDELNKNSKLYANALSSSVHGKDVTITDISPILTELDITVSKDALPDKYDIADNFSYMDGAVTGVVQGKDIAFTVHKRGTNVLYIPICNVTLTPGEYDFSGCPSDGGFTRYWLQLQKTGTAQFIQTGEEKTITVGETQGGTYTLSINIATQYIPSAEFVFSPKLASVGGTEAVSCIEYDGDGNIKAKVTPEADGTVKGIESLYPTTRITTDNDSYFVSVKYNRDLVKVIEELQQAIISLGGNV